MVTFVAHWRASWLLTRWPLITYSVVALMLRRHCKTAFFSLWKPNLPRCGMVQISPGVWTHHSATAPRSCESFVLCARLSLECLSLHCARRGGTARSKSAPWRRTYVEHVNRRDRHILCLTTWQVYHPHFSLGSTNRNIERIFTCTAKWHCIVSIRWTQT